MKWYFRKECVIIYEVVIISSYWAHVLYVVDLRNQDNRVAWWCHLLVNSLWTGRISRTKDNPVVSVPPSCVNEFIFAPKSLPCDWILCVHTCFHYWHCDNLQYVLHKSKPSIYILRTIVHPRFCIDMCIVRCDQQYIL